MPLAVPYQPAEHAPHAIDGFTATFATTNLTLHAGSVDNVKRAGEVIALAGVLAAANTAKILISADADNPSAALVATKGTDAASPTLPATPAGRVGLVSCTVSTSAVTASSFEGRGQLPAI